MVRFLVDVQWGVPWLVVWAVFTTLEVERDVEKVDGRGVRFYGDLKAIFTEDLAYAFFVFSTKRGDLPLTADSLSSR